jgi:hypothetical protein
MRYGTTTSIQTNTEKYRRATTIYPEIPIAPATDIYIRTTTIERLDKLAYKFYGDAALWWIIATANALGKGTLIIPSNTRVRIPSSQNIKELLINTNLTR